MRQIQRAFLIPDMNVEMEIEDDDDLQFRVFGESDTHIVHIDHGLARCTCEDYQFAKDKDLGSYLCKHIVKCIWYIQNRKEKQLECINDEFINAGDLWLESHSKQS